jgi:AcrR family transcriptional regulator
MHYDDQHPEVHMSPRPYRLGRREAGVGETRDKVLEAARAIFSEVGFQATTLDDVAQRANVARATVYYQFESKYGLLGATIEHVLRRSPGTERMRKALEMTDAATGMRAYIREACRFWEGDYVFFRNVIGMAAIDPEAAQATDEYDQQRRDGLVWLSKRLADQGQLRPGIGQKQAQDTIWLLTSFRAYSHLRGRGGLKTAKATELLTAVAETILADDGRRAGA